MPKKRRKKYINGNDDLYKQLTPSRSVIVREVNLGMSRCLSCHRIYRIKSPRDCHPYHEIINPKYTFYSHFSGISTPAGDCAQRQAAFALGRCIEKLCKCHKERNERNCVNSTEVLR